MRIWRYFSRAGSIRRFLLAWFAVGLICGPASAMRLGSGESPIAAGTFDAVGRLECGSDDGRARVRDATGWVVGGADTVVTAAHGLFARGAPIDPRRCVFRLLNPDGSVRETARLLYVRSPWAESRHRNDSAYDVAVLKLDRRMGVDLIPVVRSPSAGRPVRLVSFPADAAGGRARVSSGETRPFPHGATRDRDGVLRVTDPSRLFASSADSAAGSSGGLYYAPGARAAVGLHVGYVCVGGGCFNIGLRFDADLLAMIAQVAADGSLADRQRMALAGPPSANPTRALR